MFWTIAATLTLEWLVAVVCRFTLHGFIHGLLWLAGIAIVLALASRLHSAERTRQHLPFSAASAPLPLVVLVRQKPSA